MYLTHLAVAHQSRSPTTAVMGTAAAEYVNQNFPYTDSGPGKTVALTLLLTLLSGGGTVVASPYVNQNVQLAIPLNVEHKLTRQRRWDKQETQEYM